MKIKVTSRIEGERILAERGLGKSRAAQWFLAMQVAELSEPYVPFESGALKNEYQIPEDGSAVVYPGPYAHYQYYGEVMAGSAPKHYTGRAIDYDGSPMRGKEWDKRMWADKGDEIVDALARRVGGKAK